MAFYGKLMLCSTVLTLLYWGVGSRSEVAAEIQTFNTASPRGTIKLNKNAVTCLYNDYCVLLHFIQLLYVPFASMIFLASGDSVQMSR